MPHWTSSLSFAEAAGLPLAGLTAYQALTEALDVHEGQRVLVHRAAGGVGFFAVQIAVALGAQVIGTASPRNHGFVRDAGAAEVLARMADAGQLRVPIAKAFPLEQTAAAQELVAGGHVRGKVVITLR